MKKRDYVTLVVIGIIFLIITIIILIDSKSGNNENKTEYNELTLLKDEVIFLSVSNNINKTINYSNNNNKALNYIFKNEINKDEYKNTTFKAEKIYVVSNLNLYKYYIKGNLYRELLDTLPEYIRDEYFILNYDMEHTTYNIEKISKKKFDNAFNEEYIFEKINSNEYNNFEYSSLTQKGRASMYFQDFLNKTYYEIENAYDILSKETKDKYFENPEDLKQFISKYNNISISEFGNSSKKIGIRDNYGNEYVFDIFYVMQYNVTINKAEG